MERAIDWLCREVDEMLNSVFYMCVNLPMNKLIKNVKEHHIKDITSKERDHPTLL